MLFELYLSSLKSISRRFILELVGLSNPYINIFSLACSHSKPLRFHPMFIFFRSLNNSLGVYFKFDLQNLSGFAVARSSKFVYICCEPEERNKLVLIRNNDCYLGRGWISPVEHGPDGLNNSSGGTVQEIEQKL